MAKITRQQILKINNECSNGWELDIFYYMSHQVKELIKRIRTDEQNFLQFKIGYNSQNQVKLSISSYYHEKDDAPAVSSGAYKTIILEETPIKYRNINYLIPYTLEYNDNKLLQLSKNTK